MLPPEPDIVFGGTVLLAVFAELEEWNVVEDDGEHLVQLTLGWLQIVAAAIHWS
jgi:hypothetical protein